ncbi:hypothetical protein RHOSPDRAFT_26530 [Rhodotorula sp. JG-1b]|nr:hypothetical protein RHOSPDRAFT_26530 [Rhodotorula sp. JG-1b]
MSSYTPDTDAAPPRQPPSMRMPDELLVEVFKHVFAELQHEPLRDQLRVYAPLSLVCKAWQRVAAPYPWTNVSLDVVENSDAIAGLDPVGGIGVRQLLLIKSLRLLASESLIQPAKEDEKEESGVEDEDEEALAARRSPILHGPADDETSSLPIVASVARILAKCSNLSVLSIDQRLESISCKVTADHDPSVIWPKLTRLNFKWRASFIDLLPILACLSRLQTLTDLVLMFATIHEEDDPRGTMTQELVDKYAIQSLEHLETFRIHSLAGTPIGSKAVLQLLSPRAPLRQVTWGGHIPPRMCKQLSKGTTQIEQLTFTWWLPELNLTKQLLPQLRELGLRSIKCLTFDIGPCIYASEAQLMPPITAVLKNLPYGARFSRAIDIYAMLGFHQSFPTGKRRICRDHGSSIRFSHDQHEDSRVERLARRQGTPPGRDLLR